MGKGDRVLGKREWGWSLACCSSMSCAWMKAGMLSSRAAEYGVSILETVSWHEAPRRRAAAISLNSALT